MKGDIVSEFLNEIIEKAKSDKKTIVMAEGNDARTLEAAEKVLQQEIANIIIVGNKAEIENSGRNLSGARIMDPKESELHEEFASKLYELRKEKGMTPEKADSAVKDDLFFGVMLIKCGYADGMVAGACHATSDVLRPSLQILKTAPGVKYVSSFFVMIVPDCQYGHNGAFLFSDCGLEPMPDVDKLANIAVNSANSFKNIFGAEPKVAMLSHSTKGSANGNDDQIKVEQATDAAIKLAPDVDIDGGLQLDAALVPEIANSKAPGSKVAGKANVLIFPDLDAGNIGYKLVQRLAKAEAYGPVTQGIAAPVNDLSRGCSADDIVGVVAITALQSQFV